jgi:hypothetical protein
MASKKKPHAAPAFVTPMAAAAVKQLPEGDEWMYEVKFIGSPYIEPVITVIHVGRLCYFNGAQSIPCGFSGDRQTAIGQNATIATRIQSPHSGRWRVDAAIGRRIRAPTRISSGE